LTQLLKTLITLWLCYCDLSHCQVSSCVWLCHSAHVLHMWTDFVLTLYSTIRVHCPASHTTVTLWQVTSIHKQLYR